MNTIIVIAKAPVPGRAKTRLCPPCTPEEAAELATACLLDTLHASLASKTDRTLLCLDGQPGDWLPRGVQVIAQRGRGFAQRLANAFVDSGTPSLLIGMDTPQVTPELLDFALEELDAPRVEAVFGPASDGGFWLLGLRAPDPNAILGVRMSQPSTGRDQLARLKSMNLWTAEIQDLRDIDTFEDAQAVALTAPRTRFAIALRDMRAGWRESGGSRVFA